MKPYRLAAGGLAITLVALSGSLLEAQQPTGFPLAPMVPRGDIVAPFFDGWYANPDGTYTLSFGFFNRNTEEIVEIPIGPDNFIEPAEFDGMQPTHFPPVSYGGFSGRRERGAFAITVPADIGRQDVVWTIRHAGQTLRVPGRVTSDAYELSHEPQAAGSLPPSLRLEAEGEEVRGRQGVTIGPLTARVGTPLPLTAWGFDQGVRENRVPVNMTWQKHQGPGSVEFSPRTIRVESGEEGVTEATFTEPGEYVLRVRVDNFSASDSSFADQCCWSNGFVRVNVTP
jgi:hypothetical protein